MNQADLAASRFAQGHNCAQAVLSVFADKCGIVETTALKLATGFGGGMGRQAETCGAVTGAMMSLGLLHGSEQPDRETREQVYAMVRDLAERFKARNETLICRELMKCDISTPDGLRRAVEENMHSTTCPKFVRDAVEILEEMESEKDR
jgi:C_GCAxxG_C_C family probable redox protein